MQNLILAPAQINRQASADILHICSTFTQVGVIHAFKGVDIVVDDLL